MTISDTPSICCRWIVLETLANPRFIELINKTEREEVIFKS